MWATHQWMVGKGQELLRSRPDASAADVLEHFRVQGEDAMFLEAPDDRAICNGPTKDSTGSSAGASWGRRPIAGPSPGTRWTSR